ncbi:MAG: antibiotic biosynthesis monooxygenase [Armatimonadetes bacterium]|nr:antibiotic biosynthesis monooxygenase [Armatimonadota bacterium]
MIVVANRIPVAIGFEQEFEERFTRRTVRLQENPGFIRNELLRPVQSDYYIVQTYWENMEAFEAWTRSESFRAAHASPPRREMFAGPNVLEIHEVFMTTENA